MRLINIIIVIILLSHCFTKSTSQVIYTNDLDSLRGHNLIDSALTNMYDNPNSAIKNCLTSISIFNQHCDIEMLGYGYQLLASCEYENGNIYTARKYIDTAITFTSILMDSLPFDYFQSQYLHRVISDEFESNTESINGYTKILKEYEENNFFIPEAKVQIQFNLAVALLSQKDYQLARIYFNKVISSLHANDDLKFRSQVNNLKISLELNQSSLSDILLHKCLLKLDSTPMSLGTRALFLRTYSEYEKINGRPENTKRLLKESLNIETSKLARAFTLDKIANHLYEINKSIDACNILLSATDTIKSYFNYEPNALVGDAYNLLATWYYELDLEEHSMDCIDSAFYYNSIDLNSIDFISLRTSIRSFLLIYNFDKNLNHLSQAISLIHQMRSDIRSLDSKIESAKRAKEVYDLAVPAALNAYIKTDSIHYFNLALYWADLSKGGVLSEQIARERMIKRFENDTLYQYYVRLSSDIHALRKQIIDQKNKNPDTLYNSKAENLLIKKRDELQAIEDSTDFVYHLSPLDTFVKRHLNQDRAILQIYRSDSALYSMFYSPTGVPQFKSTPTALCNSLLNQYLKYQSSTDVLSKDFLSLSHSIYNMIFPENVDWKNIPHLVIIPDGLCHQLSFESLITTPNFTDQLHQAPYLFKKVPISYSLGLHLTKPHLHTSSRSVAAFAPSFSEEYSAHSRDCAEEIFGSLSCNEQECQYISESLSSTNFVGTNATIDNFKLSIASPDIIHLATHACIDTNNYYKSAIVFQDDQFLVSDMYGLEWQDKTVVLSACNTAQGKNVSGEGIFNFARTLTELGCKEVIVSLWPIDDCSTAEFIKYFYKSKSKGKSSAQALQAARSSFLDNADKLHASPVFWAPLILISNDLNVGLAPSSNLQSTLLWVLGGVAVLLLAMKTWYRRERRL